MGLKLMCVVAHPDDECYAFGGALALAADRGVETYVVCLTDGQAATNRGDAEDGEALGNMRREEFRASCEVLGVTHSELMDCQDARLEFVEFSQTAERLVERIRRFKPDVVITFGGDGGQNTHADHMMTSMLTTAAFHWSGQSKRYPGAGHPHKAQRLYYVTANFLMPDRQPAMMMPWTVTLDIRSARERKSEAFRKHVSQAPLMEKTKEIFERYGAEEFYSLVATTEPEACELRTDLFEGLS
ncbi:PIG-L deacetylase family protein [Tunturiibacter gelidiferens]|uniref:PIG-L deacetylase family protein n=1 Tax=Tunturiibacter gelidiferens TaxID=3069689 RepID=UPI003D9B3279